MFAESDAAIAALPKTLDAYWMPFTANRQVKETRAYSPLPKACTTPLPTIARS